MGGLPVSLEVFFLALLLDVLIGDPRWLVHPTQVMGLSVVKLERLLWPWATTPRLKYLAGMIIEVIIVGLSWLVTKVLITLAYKIGWLWGYFLSAWLLSTTIAARGLCLTAWEIASCLSRGDLPAARRKVAMLVGRDTERMEEREVARATIESVAENTSDGILAPLLYALVGGVPLAMAYRAINTLDSMLGYRNERYLYFGRAAARVDDFANFIPARLTGVFLCLAALLGGKAGEAWRVLWRDGSRHPSPNSGYPEAAMAGALGVRLGGLNYYQGRPEMRPFIGQGGGEPEVAHIYKAINLVIIAYLLFAIASSLVLLVVGRH